MVMSITAAGAERTNAPFELQPLTLDEPRPDEILVRIIASGICQTDAHVWHGHIPTSMPIVLGHEGSGVVERVGASVTSVKPGDHVVLSYQACGHCTPCLGGHFSYCDLAMEANFSGERLDGSTAVHRHKGEEGGAVRGHFFGQSSFATYALTTERNTVKVPDDVPLELLGPLGCGLQTGAGAVLNSFKVRPGQTIAVFGAGAVGLAAVMAAKVAAADAIIAVDVHDDRLALARQLGATHTVKVGEGQVSDRLRQITGRGVDFVLDTSGRSEMLAQAVDGLATLGQLGLVASAGGDGKVEAAKLNLGVAVRGIVQGDAVPQLFIPALIRLYKSGHFPFDRLVRFYPFEQINEAFAASARGEVIKPIIRIGDL